MLKRQASAALRVLMSRRGAAMVEYAILAAVIAMVGSVALTSLGTSMRTMFTTLATKI